MMKDEEIMGIPKQGLVIAIDGPAGTGKSSVTHRLADVLGFIHVDTGALYRAVAFLNLEKEAELEEEIAATIARGVHLDFRRIPGKNPVNRMMANGRDLTELIRTSQVSLAASRISAFSKVRAALIGLQRRLGCSGNAILEGRDIGTIIFPDADLKFYLSASLEERAKRRLIELEAIGVDVPSFEEVKDQIRDRDHGDSTRAVAPLKKAVDAIEVDTSSMKLEDVVQWMEAIAREKLGLEKNV